MSKTVSFSQQLVEAQAAVKQARNVLNQPNQRGLTVPRAFPTLWVLHQMSKPPASTDYAAHNVGGVWRKARVSRRNQGRVRKMALLCGMDPVQELGLPVKKGIVGFPWSENVERKIVTKVPDGKDLDKKYAKFKKIQQEVTAVKLPLAKDGKKDKKDKKQSKPEKQEK